MTQSGMVLLNKMSKVGVPVDICDQWLEMWLEQGGILRWVTWAFR